MLPLEDIRALFDQEQRIAIAYPDAHKDMLPGLVRFTRPAPSMNFIRYSRLPAESLDAVIQAQIDDLAPRNQPFEWQVYDYDQPAALTDRLLAHGFVPDEPSPLMVLDLHNPPAALMAPVAADIRVLTRPDQLDPVVAIMTEVWGGDFSWMRQRFAAHLAQPDYLRIYVAYVDDQPACAGWIYLHPNSQFAGLYGGSTIPLHRGQGLYTAVLALRVQDARQRGYRFLTIEASPMSQPIVAKHGFQVLSYIRAYEWEGPQPGSS